MPEFQKVEVPVGAFIGWAAKPTSPPQQVTIEVLNFDQTGGRTFNSESCPQLTGTLVEDAVSYRDKGTTKVTLKAGEMVSVTGAQANLRKGLLQADPARGDLIRLTHTENYATAQGDGKVIEVEKAPAADSVSADDL